MLGVEEVLCSLFFSLVSTQPFKALNLLVVERSQRAGRADQDRFVGIEYHSEGCSERVECPERPTNRGAAGIEASSGGTHAPTDGCPTDSEVCEQWRHCTMKATSGGI